jgi:phosphonate transport system substrate-binding protein
MRWFVVMLGLVLASPVHAVERLLLGVNTGVPAQDELRDLTEKYRPLATYLSTQLKRPVKLEVSQNLSASGRRLKRDAFDLFIGPPQVIAQAMKTSDYEPIVRYPGKIKAVFVAMESSGISKLADAKGKRLGLPDKDSLPSYLALAKFRLNRINPDVYFSLVLHQRFQDATLNALQMGHVDMAAVTSGYAKKWVQDHPGARVVEETWEVPQFALAVRGDLGDVETKKIKQILLDAANTVDGKVMLEKIGHKDGFVATDKAEYGPLIRLFDI